MRKKTSLKQRRNEGGQALIEFLLFIPILMALLWYMVHVNMAINASVVGQKHARSQLFSKLFNHRAGPGNTSAQDQGADSGSLDDLGSLKRSAYFIGVSKDLIDGAPAVPAPVITMGIGPRPKINPDANDAIGEAETGSLRQRIRVRTAFGICTHRKTDATGKISDFCAELE